MSMKLFFGITCLLLLFTTTYCQSDECYAPDGSPYVYFCDLDVTLRRQLMEKFDVNGTNNPDRTFVDLVGKLVRLIFHDCFGPKEYDSTVPAICDGCIDFDNPKHAGLEHEAIDKIAQIYVSNENNWDQRMTRADFWAACATIAIQQSVKFQNETWRIIPENEVGDALPYIPFYIGRQDCSASPDINIDNYQDTKWDDSAGKNGAGAQIVAKSFGEATGGFSKNYALFQQGLGLKPREYVALLGVHTLGRVKKTNSGFGTDLGKPWVPSWDRLDNAFYHMLLDDEKIEDKIDWIQHETELGGQFEWRDTLRVDPKTGIPKNETRFVMLNSDMALVKNLDNIQFNQATGECPFPHNTYNELNDRPRSMKFVKEFANNNQVWLDAFGQVFDKLIRAGYDGYDNANLSVLAEDWYLEKYGNVKTFEQPVCAEIFEYQDPSGPYGPYGQKKWAGGQENIVRKDVNKTLWAFVSDHSECYVYSEKGDFPYLNYYYNYFYDDINDMLSIDVIVCCGKNGAVFDNYTAPDGYILRTFEDDDSFIGNDEKNTKTEILIKHIIVWSIVGFICLLCGIGAMFVYKKYNKKQIEIEKQTADIITKPTSPDQDKEGKDKSKSRKKKSNTVVDVKTPIMELDGCGTDLPAANPYVVANNSSIQQYKL